MPGIGEVGEHFRSAVTGVCTVSHRTRLGRHEVTPRRRHLTGFRDDARAVRADVVVLAAFHPRCRCWSRSEAWSGRGWSKLNGRI